jgi:hypothetical protein
MRYKHVKGFQNLKFLFLDIFSKEGRHDAHVHLVRVGISNWD